MRKQPPPLPGQTDEGVKYVDPADVKAMEDKHYQEARIVLAEQAKSGSAIASFLMISFAVALAFLPFNIPYIGKWPIVIGVAVGALQALFGEKDESNLILTSEVYGRAAVDKADPALIERLLREKNSDGPPERKRLPGPDVPWPVTVIVIAAFYAILWWYVGAFD